MEFEHQPLKNIYIFFLKGKLHFTTLNYASDYTLHHKLFECTVYTLNYDHCYTLHPNISFTVKFDTIIKRVTCTCVLLKWHKLKRPKTPHLLNQVNFFPISLMRTSPSPQIKNPCSHKSLNQNHLWHYPIAPPPWHHS